VQIKADGEYFEIEDFVLKMERLARALRIDDFSLAAGGENESNTLTASMKVQMFMITPQAAAGAATPSGQTAQGTSEGA
jgi:Tfp pilus assembly protein PilO